MPVNFKCPESVYCKSLCGPGCSPMCEPGDKYIMCQIHIEQEFKKYEELYKLTHQT
jgi:hypothetical protein